ncbi:cyclin-like protein [Gonapodya prolifera JEL478]|uniref:Cyclin-like protein n=1 Tax=Gonapodya prolifera (strain JEL478) TaxID=1344416 RepID=A0A139A2R4_GONPJ|nr:cyclin-like protein [Gonapodya prolifera JEL478]|eukprot:KXS10989.1 cyclin-like protein [Gonapodya prolifera JEL478]
MASETSFVTTMRFPLNSNVYHTQLFFTREELANHNQQHGIYPQTELAIRKYAMENIERLGRCLRLPWRTHATAKALFNRFYATHAMTTAEFPTVHVAQGCLFISCKIEETNKKLKEIIVEYGKEFNQKEPDEMDCERTKKEYLNIERVVLETIGFDFRIFHPQKFVIKFCDKLSNPTVSMTGRRLPEVLSVLL